MKLSARTALIPIDVQQAFDHPRWGTRNNPGMEQNGLALLAAWREQGWPIIHVRHDSIAAGSTLRPGQPGNAHKPGFSPQGDEAMVTKSVNAAFIGTDLELRLRRLDVESVVLFGIATDMCVSTTARVASNLGFRTLVVSDACLCFDVVDAQGDRIAAHDVHRVHLATLAAEFAQVATTAQVIAGTQGVRSAA